MAYSGERANDIRVLFEAAQQLDRELLERALAVAQERDLDPAELLRLVGQNFQHLGWSLPEPPKDGE